MAEQEMYFRPPSEAESFIIRVMHGCPHNKCTFCNLFKETPFKPVPVEEVAAGLDQDARELSPELREMVTSMYLEGGDPLALPPVDLLTIMEHAKSSFPKLTRFADSATARFTGQKTLDELKRLQKAGLTRLFIGLESGCDQILEATNKGCSAADLKRVGLMLKEAGLEMDVSMMLGIGGPHYSQKHAVGTADLLNAIEPVCVRIRTFLPKKETPLGDDYLQGSFALMEPHQILAELRLMVEHITGRMQLLSEHWSDFILFNAYMPEAKEELLKYIDAALAEPRESYRQVGLSEGRA